MFADLANKRPGFMEHAGSYRIHKSQVLAYIQSMLSPILQSHKLFLYDRKIPTRIIRLHPTITLSHLQFLCVKS
jgi:hypothetical protein